MSSRIRRLGVADTLGEATAGVLDHPLRSALAAIGTVLGVGTVVAVLGLTLTAGNQISRSFTLAAITEVKVTEHGTENDPGPAFPDDALPRVERIPGVESVGLHWKAGVNDVHTASAEATVDENIDLQVEVASAGYLQAVQTRLREGTLFNPMHDRDALPVALLGTGAARTLGVTSVANHPRVVVDGVTLQVIGLIDGAERRPDLAAAIVVPLRLGQQHWRAGGDAEMLVITRPGAAPTVAGQLAAALRPDAPSRIVVTPPPDPRELRESVETDFAGLLLALAGVSLLVSVFGIANSTTMSVVERTHEIGLRRALGAQRSDIAVQFMLETMALGGLGGLLGSSLGILAVVGVSLAQQWTAVVDPLFLLLGPALGALIGALAGIYPAVRAARVEPVTALRS